MPQEPVKIIMGLHPQAGWRSFKTSQPVSHHLTPRGVFVAAPGYWPRQEWMDQMHLTPFGAQLLEELEMIDFAIAFVRFRYQQFEIFVQMDHDWDESLQTVLWAIARAHSGSPDYELEKRDMSGGKELWNTYFLEELEEIEEFSDSFTTN